LLGIWDIKSRPTIVVALLVSLSFSLVSPYNLYAQGSAIYRDEFPPIVAPTTPACQRLSGSSITTHVDLCDGYDSRDNLYTWRICKGYLVYGNSNFPVQLCRGYHSRNFREYQWICEGLFYQAMNIDPYPYKWNCYDEIYEETYPGSNIAIGSWKVDRLRRSIIGEGFVPSLTESRRKFEAFIQVRDISPYLYLVPDAIKR
jgi:hypothetical protein